ncbi:MAG: rubrerythrin family protein [Patescibacteria group bacterium]|jgi:rubrerythrin
MLGPKTKKNLETAFAGESQARNKYDYFASVARKAGYEQIANFFTETALNEKEHAKVWAKQLEMIGDLPANLKAAIAGENYENTQMYPTMEKEALEEGHTEIAKLFKEVGEVEKAHEARYKKLLANLEKGEVFKKPEVKRWKCSNCGYIHEGTEAPGVCPACSHPQAFYEVLAENY